MKKKFECGLYDKIPLKFNLIEKIEFLTNLIFLIWQGPDATMSSAQKSILDNVLMSYYHQYFNLGTEWYENKSSEELILYLGKYNIHQEDIYAQYENEVNGQHTYYDVLGIAFDASPDEVGISHLSFVMMSGTSQHSGRRRESRWRLRGECGSL